MKAIVYRRYGTPDVLELAEVPKPMPKANEMLVRIRAASLNSWDADFLKGASFIARVIGGLRRPRHPILGTDIAGEVEAVGEDVTKFHPGDVVFGEVSKRLLSIGWGAFAEYACVRENSMTLKPPNMTFEEAAAIPQVAALALECLHYNGDIQPSQSVLINGAGGGVGTFAVQIAKTFGAEITGVDRTDKLDMLRSIGADHVIDYTQEDFTQNGKRYDLIIDVAAYRPPLDYKRATE
jgi:NADPH:quinone reductase-like Zn-dependent oxidoreductase